MIKNLIIVVLVVLCIGLVSVLVLRPADKPVAAATEPVEPSVETPPEPPGVSDVPTPIAARPSPPAATEPVEGRNPPGRMKIALCLLGVAVVVPLGVVPELCRRLWGVAPPASQMRTSVPS